MPSCTPILTQGLKVPVKAVPKKVYPKASVIEVDDDDDDDRPESAAEDEEDELSKQTILYCLRRKTYSKLVQMMKQWTSPVYTFYEAIPDIQYIAGHHMHVFKYAAKSCSYNCWRFLDGPDCSSTGNLIKHVKSCWGKAAYEAAMACQHAKDARESVIKPLTTTGTITAAFEQKGKGKVTYWHRQHTKKETK